MMNMGQVRKLLNVTLDNIEHSGAKLKKFQIVDNDAECTKVILEYCPKVEQAQMHNAVTISLLELTLEGIEDSGGQLLKFLIEESLESMCVILEFENTQKQQNDTAVASPTMDITGLSYTDQTKHGVDRTQTTAATKSFYKEKRPKTDKSNEPIASPSTFKYDQSQVTTNTKVKDFSSTFEKSYVDDGNNYMHERCQNPRDKPSDISQSQYYSKHKPLLIHQKQMSFDDAYSNNYGNEETPDPQELAFKPPVNDGYTTYPPKRNQMANLTDHSDNNDISYADNTSLHSMDNNMPCPFTKRNIVGMKDNLPKWCPIASKVRQDFNSSAHHQVSFSKLNQDNKWQSMPQLKQPLHKSDTSNAQNTSSMLRVGEIMPSQNKWHFGSQVILNEHNNRGGCSREEYCKTCDTKNIHHCDMQDQFFRNNQNTPRRERNLFGSSKNNDNIHNCSSNHEYTQGCSNALSRRRSLSLTTNKCDNMHLVGRCKHYVMNENGSRQGLPCDNQNNQRCSICISNDKDNRNSHNCSPHCITIDSLNDNANSSYRSSFNSCELPSMYHNTSYDNHCIQIGNGCGDSPPPLPRKSKLYGSQHLTNSMPSLTGEHIYGNIPMELQQSGTKTTHDGLNHLQEKTQAKAKKHFLKGVMAHGFLKKLSFGKQKTGKDIKDVNAPIVTFNNGDIKPSILKSPKVTKTIVQSPIHPMGEEQNSGEFESSLMYKDIPLITDDIVCETVSLAHNSPSGNNNSSACMDLYSFSNGNTNVSNVSKESDVMNMKNGYMHISDIKNGSACTKSTDLKGEERDIVTPLPVIERTTPKIKRHRLQSPSTNVADGTKKGTANTESKYDDKEPQSDRMNVDSIKTDTGGQTSKESARKGDDQSTKKSDISSDDTQDDSEDSGDDSDDSAELVSDLKTKGKRKGILTRSKSLYV